MCLEVNGNIYSKERITSYLKDTVNLSRTHTLDTLQVHPEQRLINRPVRQNQGWSLVCLHRFSVENQPNSCESGTSSPASHGCYCLDS